jgi:hypothetical protein
MRSIVFDIETGALPEAELEKSLPPFDPSEVKTGNMTDPRKIAAKIADAEAKHRRDYFERAALDPLTGRVLAVGLLYPATSEFVVLGDDDEEEVLKKFWDRTLGEMGRVNQMVGFNTHLFDLPFLIRRSYKHRVEVPFGIRRGRYWGQEMVDLREEWQLGDRQERGSLDSIAKYLGVGQKVGQGEDFALLWQKDREKAIAYLRNDLEVTTRIAEALRVIHIGAVAVDY